MCLAHSSWIVPIEMQINVSISSHFIRLSQHNDDKHANSFGFTCYTFHLMRIHQPLIKNHSKFSIESKFIRLQNITLELCIDDLLFHSSKFLKLLMSHAVKCVRGMES